MNELELIDARRILDAGEDLSGYPQAVVDAVGVALAQRIIMTEGQTALERFLLALGQERGGVIHHFGPGVYSREVTLPAGILAMGHRQRCPHTNIMLAGRVTMIGEDGAVQTIQAPVMGVGAPGRKVGVIHEEMTWLNVYANPDNCQDVATLEGRLVDKTGESEGAVDAERMQRPADADRESYAVLLGRCGLTEADAQADIAAGGDVVPLPWGAYKCRTAPSPIQGLGLFATADIAPGETIAPALVGGCKTIVGRFVNHGAAPNAELRARADGGLDLVALRPIVGNRGGFDGDEILIDYGTRLLPALLGETVT